MPTRMGFEPTRAEHIRLAVQRLNHSATSSISYQYSDLCRKIMFEACFGTLGQSQGQWLCSVLYYMALLTKTEIDTESCLDFPI